MTFKVTYRRVIPGTHGMPNGPYYRPARALDTVTYSTEQGAFMAIMRHAHAPLTWTVAANWNGTESYPVATSASAMYLVRATS